MRKQKGRKERKAIGKKESPVKKELELVRRGNDLSICVSSQRRVSYAGKSGDWESCLEEFRQDDKLSVWAGIKVKECYEKIESEDVCLLSIAQDILRKSKALLRRSVAPNDGVGGVTLSYVCPLCHCFPLEDYIWWVSSGHGDGKEKKTKQRNWWCAACGGQYDWRAPNRVLVVPDSAGPREAKVFRARNATRNMRQLDQLAVALDKPAKGWRQSSSTHLYRCWKKVAEVLQSRSRLASRNKVHKSGAAKVYDRHPRSSCSRRRG